ncbi:Vitamin K epoxide reductase [Bifidobacterium margollesii]|uniref:Vitamin K epoxide reductase n=1 Tax=Bifidobacterium margollesii TaxID=2020964 RepID=A0A2N5JAC1_9BIFI|nr:vitamin K epoxide reductase family protein [Bifidobacterium margollesii]PLS31162.1 Vitamin K epoxide reductase [Bifidobacterium margollesii]
MIDESAEYLGTPTGWRHGAVWTYLLMLVFSLAALIISLGLSAETLLLARNPGSKLDCDVNSVISCSTVAQSWQAEIIKFGDMSFPNAFFGIAAESVFVTIAVLGLARISVPRWFAVCTWLGGLAALAYAYWLFTQSVFVINALCLWCLGLMFSTTLQFMTLSHATVTVQNLPRLNGTGSSFRRALDTYYRLGADLLVDVLWLAALIAIILVKDGSAIF